MKITKARLKEIIKEELGRVLAEGRSSGFQFEDTEIKIEFLGMEAAYLYAAPDDDRETRVKLGINGKAVVFPVKEDPATVGALADEIIHHVAPQYWFLDGNSPDLVSAFKAKLEETLKAIGADPEAEDIPTRQADPPAW